MHLRRIGSCLAVLLLVGCFPQTQSMRLDRAVEPKGGAGGVPAPTLCPAVQVVPLPPAASPAYPSFPPYPPYPPFPPYPAWPSQPKTGCEAPEPPCQYVGCQGPTDDSFEHRLELELKLQVQSDDAALARQVSKQKADADFVHIKLGPDVAYDGTIQGFHETLQGILCVVVWVTVIGLLLLVLIALGGQRVIAALFEEFDKSKVGGKFSKALAALAIMGTWVPLLLAALVVLSALSYCKGPVAIAPGLVQLPPVYMGPEPPPPVDRSVPPSTAEWSALKSDIAFLKGQMDAHLRDATPERGSASWSWSSIVAAILSGTISSLAVLLVANRYTKKAKQVDATLEFNKRFQELWKEQRAIDSEYSRTTPADPREPEMRESGRFWWYRYFDLMLFEFHFFREGLIDRQRFTQWMTFRHYEFKSEDSTKNTTCGVTYREAWDAWKSAKAFNQEPFIRFLDTVHNANGLEGVDRVVKEYEKPWWSLF